MRRPAHSAAALGALFLWGCAPATSTAGRSVLDGLGRQVRVPFVVHRVVSLAPSVTETIEALDLGDRLVGVTDFCTVPASRKGVRRIGGLLTPDLEAIRSLRPDLVIGTTSGNDPALAAQAEALGLSLYILHATDVEGVLRGIDQLGAALGEPASGAHLAAELRARLQAVRDKVGGRPRPRVLFIIWDDPLVVPGAGAFLTDAIQDAGGESVTRSATAAHVAFSAESAVASAPEVILTTRENKSLREKLAGNPAWAAVPAVRAGRIHAIGDAVVRPGPGVVEGIEEMARLLHPEAYPRGPEGRGP